MANLRLSTALNRATEVPSVTRKPAPRSSDFLSAVKNATPLRIVVVLVAAGTLAALVRFILKLQSNGGHGGELAENIWFHSDKWCRCQHWCAPSSLS